MARKRRRRKAFECQWCDTTEAPVLGKFRGASRSVLMCPVCKGVRK